MPSPKNNRTLSWGIIATVILGIAVWQARVVTKGDLLAAWELMRPPSKTKTSDRAQDVTMRLPADAAYAARCARGMTTQEIQWVLDDFENIGLGRKNSLPLLEWQAAQRKWYLQVLTEGMQLTREQTAVATKRMEAAFDKSRQEHETWLKKKEQLGAALSEIDERWGDFIHYEDPFLRLLNIGPWVLCDFTPEQERMTWKKWQEIVNEKLTKFPRDHPGVGIDAINGLPTARELAALTGGPVFRSTEPHTTYDPGGILPVLATQNVEPTMDLDNPFLEPTDEELQKFLKDIHQLHPAQLKMMLLVHPHFEGYVQKGLMREVP